MFVTVLNAYGSIKSATFGFACVAMVGLAGCQTTTSASMANTTAATVRPATQAEIEAIAVGNTLGPRTYNADGTYLFRGANPGRYTISDGQICVQFDSGFSRCDRVVTDGTQMTLINSDGEQFPFAG